MSSAAADHHKRRPPRPGTAARARALPPRHESWSPAADTSTDDASGQEHASASSASSSSSLQQQQQQQQEAEDNNPSDEEEHSYEGEGLEVVISSKSDEVDAVEMHLPDVDGSSAPLEASMVSRAPASRSSSLTSVSSATFVPTNSATNDTSVSSGIASRFPRPGGGTSRRSHSTSEVPTPPSRMRRAPSSSGGGGGPGRRRPPSSSSSAASSSSSTSLRRSASTAAGSRRPVLRRAVSDTAATTKKKPGMVAMAKLGYQECVNAIIRPPRAVSYKEEVLGPEIFNYCGRTFARNDLYLKNARGMRMKCSLWQDVQLPAERVPCVVYMHGNSSARLEVVPQLSYLLSLGVSVFSFDFSGSGKSDGDYVSLGYYERDDLSTVIKYLRSTGTVSTIALWGRSMGAATALMHVHRDPSIACMICDSSFADLTQLAEEMVERGKEHGVNVPNFVVSMALRMIRGSVKKQANFDIKHCRPIANADQCFVPALFVHGEKDVFIKKHHSQDIHDMYAGDKNLIVVDGDHNSPRPRFMFDSAAIFLQTCLQIPPDWTLARDPRMNRMTPPWFYPGALDGLGLAFSRSLSSSSSCLPSISPTSTKEAATTSTAAASGDAAAAASDSATAMDKAKAAQISNDEAVAAALAAELDEKTGMTIERQDEIQSSLFKMLGGPSEGKANTETTENETASSREEEEEDARSPSPSSSTSDDTLQRTATSTDNLAAAGLVRCQSVQDKRKGGA